MRTGYRALRTAQLPQTPSEPAVPALDIAFSFARSFANRSRRISMSAHQQPKTNATITPATPANESAEDHVHTLSPLATRRR